MEKQMAIGPYAFNLNYGALYRNTKPRMKITMSDFGMASQVFPGNSGEHPATPMSNAGSSPQASEMEVDPFLSKRSEPRQYLWAARDL